jgi:hypothetical protein
MSVMVEHRHDAHYAPAGPVVAAPDPFSRFLMRFGAATPRWASPVLVAVCFFGGVAYALASHPTEAGAADSPTCLMKLTTGFDCPGCGGTRALWYLLHGNVPAAARSHLLAVFAAPFLIYVYIVWAARVMFHKQLPPLRISPTVIAVFLAVWGVWAVARNLPWAPFTWFFV